VKITQLANLSISLHSSIINTSEARKAHIQFPFSSSSGSHDNFGGDFCPVIKDTQKNSIIFLPDKSLVSLRTQM
jgi:hypothetical protein